MVEEPTTGTLLQVSQLSQGYQSLLGIGMDFARRLAIGHRDQPGLQDLHTTPALMLVDEIDLHLHPEWQQQVLDDLLAAFPATQFIVTTHSPQVLTTLAKNQIRLLNCDEQGQWTARQPLTSPLARESSEALAMVMGVPPRPERSDLLPDIEAYELLARRGQADAPQARAIKARLTAAGFEFSDAEQALFTFLARKAA